MRHWKQHWDPDADLVFAKRLRIGDNPEKPFAMPGEPVTEEHRAKLGLNRLRRWFENGTLELANFVAPEPQRRLALQDRGAKLAVKQELAGLDRVEQLVDSLEPSEEEIREQKRLERNAKDRARRARQKAARVNSEG